MKLKLLILFVLATLVGQGQTSADSVYGPRGRVKREYFAPNAPYGIPNLGADAKIPSSQVPAGGGSTDTTHLSRRINYKQDQLIPGTGVTISGNTISATGGSTSGDVIGWSASALGITPSGSDQTSTFNSVFSNIVSTYNTVWFNQKGTYTINGTVNMQGKHIWIMPGAVLRGTGTITNFVLHAGGSYQIFDTTLDVSPKAIDGNVFYPDWYGANPLDGVDDYEYCQKSVNTLIIAKLPKLQFNGGNYILSRCIQVSRNIAGPSFINEFVQLDISGVPGNYDQNISSGTKLTALDGQTGGIFIRNGKGCIIENLEIVGPNTLPGSYDEYDANTNPASTFVTPGVRDERYSPNAGICIDPTGAAPTYPNLGYMATGGTRGSTKVMIRNVNVYNFVVNICISPNGQSQNAEIITMDDCTVGAGKVGVSTGNTQTRTCWFVKGMMWGHLLVGFDASSYGSVNSQLPDVRGVNMANGQRWLYKTGSFKNKASFVGVYAELLAGLGGGLDNGASGTDVYFTDCDIRLQGSTYEGGATLSRDPITTLRARTASFVNTWLWHYGTEATGINMSCASVSFVNSFLTETVNNGSGMVKYIMTQVGALTYDDNMPIEAKGQDFTSAGTGVRLLTSAVISNTGAKRYFEPSSISTAPGVGGTVSSIRPLDNSWKYTVSNPVFVKDMMVGDEVTTLNSTMLDEFGQSNRPWKMGVVDSVNYTTGEVKVKNLRPGIEPGVVFTAIYVSRPYAVKPYHIGTAASGSVVFTNVVRESNVTTVAYKAGETIISSAFADGFAEIVSVSGTSITFNKTASTSGRAVLTMYPYKQILKGVAIGQLPAVGFKVGDEVEYNEQRWICTVAGIPGNATYEPTFLKASYIAP